MSLVRLPLSEIVATLELLSRLGVTTSDFTYIRTDLQHAQAVANSIKRAPLFPPLLEDHLQVSSLTEALSSRTKNCLWRIGVTHVIELLAISKKEIMGVRNFGQRCMNEFYRVAESLEFEIPEDFAHWKEVVLGTLRSQPEATLASPLTTLAYYNECVTKTPYNITTLHDYMEKLQTLPEPDNLYTWGEPICSLRVIGACIRVSFRGT